MAPSRSIVRKVRTLAAVPNRRKALVAEASVRMLVARVAIVVRPFSTLAKGFGVFVPPSDPRALARGVGASDEQVQMAKDIGWAVRATAPFMPFKSVCLQQAMAAHAMLKHRGIASVMHFGAGRGESKPLEAHAWLDAAGVKVTGYPIAPNLAEIACFV